MYIRFSLQSGPATLFQVCKCVLSVSPCAPALLVLEVLANRMARLFAVLALLLVNKPAAELSNEPLLTMVNSQARQTTRTFSHVQCEHRGCSWTVGLFRMSTLIVNDRLGQYELELNHEISKTKQCIPRRTPHILRLAH